MSKLLNEVIADAKAVKDTAIQTAIATLRESFEPTVRRMISQKLTEENPEEESEFDYPEEEPMDVPDEPVAEPVAEPAAEPAATPAPAPAPEAEPVAEPEFEEDDEEDIEQTVEAMLRELEGEEMGDEEDPEMFTEDDDELEIYDDDLDGLLDELEGEDQELEPLEEEEDVDDNYDKKYNEPHPTTMEGLKRKLAKTTKNLKEAYKVIVHQKKSLNEVHLLNLKLMNVTKINSKFKLGDSDKIKVLEAFDRADTAKEVKLVYQTLVDRFSMTNSVQSKRVHEGVSRATNVIKNNQFEFSKRFMELANIKKK